MQDEGHLQILFYMELNSITEQIKGASGHSPNIEFIINIFSTNRIKKMVEEAKIFYKLIHIWLIGYLATGNITE